jgi:hypothetical protein
MYLNYLPSVSLTLSNIAKKQTAFPKQSDSRKTCSTSDHWDNNFPQNDFKIVPHRLQYRRDGSTYRVTDEKPLTLYLTYFLSDLNK